MYPGLKEQYLKMAGANKFLLDHCEKTLSGQAKLLQGVSHSVNRCNAEYSDCWEAVKEIQGRCEALETGQTEANAAIGRLQEQVASLEEAIQKARVAYAELKNGRNEQDPTHAT